MKNLPWAEALREHVCFPLTGNKFILVCLKSQSSPEGATAPAETSSLVFRNAAADPSPGVISG
jgi:hypothetical protein